MEEIFSARLRLVWERLQFSSLLSSIKFRKPQNQDSLSSLLMSRSLLTRSRMSSTDSLNSCHGWELMCSLEELHSRLTRRSSRTQRRLHTSWLEPQEDSCNLPTKSLSTSITIRCSSSTSAISSSTRLAWESRSRRSSFREPQRDRLWCSLPLSQTRPSKSAGNSWRIHSSSSLIVIPSSSSTVWSSTTWNWMRTKR